MDDEHADLKTTGFQKRDEEEPEKWEVIPAQVKEKIAWIQLREGEFLQEGDMEDLVKGPIMIAVDDYR